MRKKDIYKPIRNKIEEWIWYDDYKPAGEYYDNVEAHEEYRRWHDRDCVLTGGCLEADTMFSLWLPLRHTIVRINDMEVIRQVGNIYSKYDFLRELIGETTCKSFCLHLCRLQQNLAHYLRLAWEERMYSYSRTDS